MKISGALCTRTNCASLLRTLESLRAVRVDCPAELLIIDNGSAAGTWDALRGYSHPTLTVRRVIEEKRGLCHARNRALAESHADIIAFTDDDVRVSPEWIKALTR